MIRGGYDGVYGKPPSPEVAAEEGPSNLLLTQIDLPRVMLCRFGAGCTKDIDLYEGYHHRAIQSSSDPADQTSDNGVMNGSSPSFFQLFKHAT